MIDVTAFSYCMFCDKVQREHYYSNEYVMECHSYIQNIQGQEIKDIADVECVCVGVCVWMYALSKTKIEE